MRIPSYGTFFAICGTFYKHALLHIVFWQVKQKVLEKEKFPSAPFAEKFGFTQKLKPSSLQLTALGKLKVSSSTLTFSTQIYADTELDLDVGNDPLSLHVCTWARIQRRG